VRFRRLDRNPSESLRSLKIAKNQSNPGEITSSLKFRIAGSAASRFAQEIGPHQSQLVRTRPWRPASAPFPRNPRGPPFPRQVSPERGLLSQHRLEAGNRAASDSRRKAGSIDFQVEPDRIYSCREASSLSEAARIRIGTAVRFAKTPVMRASLEC
jgi:hypothetical protein